MKIEFNNVFEGLKLLSMTDNNQSKAFLCETTRHGLVPFYVAVLWFSDEYHGKRSFSTVKECQNFINEYVGV